MVLSLKNKYSVLVLFVCLTGLFSQCSHGIEKKDAVANKDTSACAANKINPNGSSELSVLMRSMLKSSASMKELIKQGKLPEKFPEEFLKIHTAQPTDADTKKPSFDGFASAYLTNLNNLYHSPKEQLKQNYNAVVNACVSCHSEHCPGPLVAIRKLSIPE